jgi:hypothetical protein
MKQWVSVKDSVPSIIEGTIASREVIVYRSSGNVERCIYISGTRTWHIYFDEFYTSPLRDIMFWVDEPEGIKNE